MTPAVFNGEPGIVAIFTHAEVDGQMQSLAYSSDGGDLEKV